MLFANALVYALASVAYFAHIALSRERLARVGRGFLLAAFALHAVDIGLRCVQGTHPFASPAEVLSLVAWLTVGGYLALSLRHALTALGAFIAPAALMLLALGRFSRVGLLHSGIDLGTLGRIHISLATAGIATFGLAAAVAFLYLLEEAQLKRRKPGIWLTQGTALRTLDEINRRCVTFGFPLFTVALLSGVVWVVRLHAARTTVFAFRPEYSFALATWIAFGALMVARLTAGWRGRRAAWMTLVGFGGALAVLGLYLFRGSV